MGEFDCFCQMHGYVFCIRLQGWDRGLYNIADSSSLQHGFERLPDLSISVRWEDGYRCLLLLLTN